MQAKLILEIGADSADVVTRGTEHRRRQPRRIDGLVQIEGRRRTAAEFTVGGTQTSLDAGHETMLDATSPKGRGHESVGLQLVPCAQFAIGKPRRGSPISPQSNVAGQIEIAVDVGIPSRRMQRRLVPETSVEPDAWRCIPSGPMIVG